MSHHNIRRKLAAGATVGLLVSAACSGGHGGPLPSVSQSSSVIVAAYGANQQQLLQTISDASSAGKTARFLTVTTQKNSYRFSPKSPVVRTNVALMVGAFGHLYVWPWTSVKQIVYSGSAIPVEPRSIPAVRAKEADIAVESIMSSVDNAAKKGTLQPSQRGNEEATCPDCFVVLRKRRSDGQSDPSVQTVDPWQQNADYSDWVDPAVPAQAVPAEPPVPVPSSGIHPQWCSSFSGGYGGGGFCAPNWWACGYWYCTLFYFPRFYFYNGVYGLTNDPAGCAIDQNYCNFTDGDVDSLLAYSDGQGGLFTSAPWSCLPGSDDLSTTAGAVWTGGDGFACSTWQILQYFDEYCSYASCVPANNFAIGDVERISISIADTAKSFENLGINAGHLYIQYWSKPTDYATIAGLRIPIGTPLEAGPQNRSDVPLFGKLITRQYGENALGDAYYFLPIDTKNNNLAVFLKEQEFQDLADTYNLNEPCCAPNYDPTYTNSNTWVDGLLLKDGYTQTQLNKYYSVIAVRRIPYAASNGALIEYLF